MSGPVPVAASLADIYPPAALATEGPRWDGLLSRFRDVYGHPAALVARSPGRVNIIGEHVDYSLYPALLMAITADTLIAVSARPADGAATLGVRLAHFQDSKFPSVDLEVPADGHVEIDGLRHEWSNYFKAGLRGALDLLRTKRGPAYRPCHLDVLVDGNVPLGGGLSSSAAFVSASALAVLVANGEATVDKTELTQLAIVSERAAGVNSGGMDQAASVFSQKGHAIFVTFSPCLAARPVKFPPTRPELCFVIAQSFVTSNKQVTAPIHYNLRVVEVSFAAAYLNALLNPPGTELPADDGPLGISLRGFHEAYFAHEDASDPGAVKSLSMEEELEKLVALAEATLTREEGYTKEEIAEVLGVSVAELEKRFLSSFPVRAERFKLRQRTLHVWTDTLRVLRFLGLLERPLHTGASDTTAFNLELGRLLNEAHESGTSQYQCSCPEVDDICRIARAAGAYGSRQTGAGWGGCSVHLVATDKVADVKEALEREYYSGMQLTELQREEAVVVSRPAGGSAIYHVGKC